VLGHKVLVKIGLISYPLYLWHWPLLSYAWILNGGRPEPAVRAILALAAFPLAWLTFKFFETPLRFGPRPRIKALALSSLMLLLAALGLTAWFGEGLVNWRDPRLKLHALNQNEMIRLPAQDETCLKYTGWAKGTLAYCRFYDAGSPITAAVIGDSHAHVAFPGLARMLAAQGVNTVLLAVSGGPRLSPLFETDISPAGVVKAAGRPAGIDRILAVMENRPDIRSVYIFTRGPAYMSGEPADVQEAGPPLPAPLFRAFFQSAVDGLSRQGRKVRLVAENPELPASPADHLARPFRPERPLPLPAKEAVRARQKEYLEILNSLKGAQVIDLLDDFCPADQCRAFSDEGFLLYADDDHLSAAGSDFQAHAILRRFPPAPGGSAKFPGDRGPIQP
jgi:hypothetical protein